MVGKAAIIDAVIALMKTKTPQELSVLEIATAAGVDPALIRYYFTNKQGLMRAAATHIMDQLQARSQVMLGQDAPLEARIRKRLVLLIEALKDNPRFLQLVLNEIYSHVDTPERIDTLQGVALRGLALSEALLVGRDGDPQLDAIDPRFLHVAFLGLCTFFVDAQPMLKVLFNGEPDAEDLTGRYLDFATRLILHGIVK
ncbi:TetR/AcrR family transcriptional regulator [Pigmentiphaga sp. H8]|uniref:TetR/AcrR family transcriptional regulator n=1 Tax=Pigmentiphaga sp. H8 TaxID=2488560 RepID=UPI0013756C04|nr:TetR family transcriptional regulator [Pigmentiphaga sp. H8]